MGNTSTVNDYPMSILYEKLTIFFSAKKYGLAMISQLWLTGNFIWSPSMINGLIAIFSGVTLWFLTLWQKRKAEKRKDELHSIEIEKEKLELEAKEIALQQAKLEIEILKKELEKK